jgi:geranylgeranyl diphosphate synthase type I
MELRSDPEIRLADESPRLDSPIEWWFVQGRFASANGDTHSFMVSLFRHALEWRGLSAGSACALMISVLEEGTGKVRVHSQVDPSTSSFLVKASKLAAPRGLDAIALEAAMAEMGEYGLPRSIRAEAKPARLTSAPFRAAWGDFALEQTQRGFLLSFAEPETQRRLRFELRPRRPRLHLAGAAIANGGSMEYAAYTRLSLTGTAEDEGVSGEAWLDHQWGSHGWFLADRDQEQMLGWDWLGAQLSDGSDLLVMAHYDRSAGALLCKYTVLLEKEGAQLRHDVDIAPNEWWTSPWTGARYPVACTIRIPSFGLELRFKPRVVQQEVPTVPPMRAVWQGAGEVSGTRQGRPIFGVARLELHGYAYVANLARHLESVTARIQQNIESFLPRWLGEGDLARLTARTCALYDPRAQTEMLSTPLWDLMDRGGRQWWAAFGALMIAALGRDPQPYELLVCVTAEMLHDATVIIDDVQDNGHLRRGAECIHRRYGIDVALNAANTAYFLPMGLLADYPGLSDEQRLELYRLLSRLYARGHIGQAQDLYWSRTLTREQLGLWMADSIKPRILQVYADKTGALTEAAAEGACVIAGANAETRHACARFGRHLGIAVQIVNDIANFNPARADRAVIGSDLREGKMTFVIYHALDRLKRRDRDRLETIFCSPSLRRDEEALAEAVELVRQSGAITASREHASRMLHDEWRRLSAVLPPSDPKAMLRVLWTFLLSLGEDAVRTDFAPA